MGRKTRRFCKITSKCCIGGNEENTNGQACLPCLSERANIVMGRPANRAIGTMDSLLFPHKVLAVHVQGTPTELSDQVPKKARLLTSKQSDNRQGKNTQLG